VTDVIAGNGQNVAGDAAAAFAVLRRGGIAILPMDIGYSLIGGSAEALRRIFETKRRADSKLNAMLGDRQTHREIHILDRRGWDVVHAITVEAELPLGVIAPCRLEHPLMAALSDDALAGSTKDGTVAMLMNAGPFHAAICRLSREAGHPLFGSSANLSLSGTKFRIEDIEDEVRAIADIVVDYGLRKYHLYGASSTLLDVADCAVVRYGACFELIADVLSRRFGITLPPPPD
jgi:tRNA A37 threonylcarbamoyladenosine synthetase subunit TsaC/SUA5/YrdC